MQVLEMIIARGDRGMSRAGGGESRFLASLGMTKLTNKASKPSRFLAALGMTRFTTRNDKAYHSE